VHIAVCDDEKSIREQLIEFMEEQSKTYKMGSVTEIKIEEFSSGEALLEVKKKFDIIFLDIQMEGVNGIEAARKLRQRQDDAILIFITGLKEYVFEVFDVSAFHYLLKPIQKEKFVEVFVRAVKEAEKQKRKTEERIFFKTRNRNLTIDKSQILYVESRTRKVEIHLNQDVMEVYVTMREMENRLGEGFYRCHRGYLVNLAHVMEYSVDKISMSNGESVYMAKEKYNDFVKVYMRYLKNGGVTFV